MHCIHVNNDNAGANHEGPNDYTNRDHDPDGGDEDLHNTSGSEYRVRCEDGCGAPPDQTRVQHH